jgi:hypothetical protein
MTTNTILKAIHGAVKAGLGLAVCFSIAALFGACKNTVSGGCSCPNGTVHLAGQSCCNEGDCTCTIRHEINDIDGLPKIFIDDQTGGKLNDDKKTLMRNIINDLKGAGVLDNFISRNNTATVFIIDSTIAGGAEKINGRKIRFSIDFIVGSSDSTWGTKMVEVFSDMDSDTNVD